MSEFLFDLFSVYQDVPQKLMLEAGGFLMYEDMPAIYWESDIPADLEEALVKFGFWVDKHAKEDGSVHTLACYRGDEVEKEEDDRQLILLTNKVVRHPHDPPPALGLEGKLD